MQSFDIKNCCREYHGATNTLHKNLWCLVCLPRNKLLLIGKGLDGDKISFCLKHLIAIVFRLSRVRQRGLVEPGPRAI